MDEIINKSGGVVAIIESDGVVYSSSRNRLGMVKNGEVHNRGGSAVGRYDDKGNIYRGTSRVGYIKGDKVFDSSDHSMGKVRGSRLTEGAAVLLLLTTDE